MNSAPASSSPQAARFGRRTFARLAPHTQYLPPVVLAPFLVLFLLTVLPRFLVPYELEWMEGHSAEQAWRFAQGLPLFPNPDDSNWVSHIYAPLYHIVWGAIMRVTGDTSLAWGRLLSLASTAGIVAGLMVAVVHHTRRAAPALLAALLFIAYFKATGYWYDIARIDMMAMALAIWGIHLCCRRRLVAWHGAGAVALLFLATMTKQSLAPVAVVCWLILLVRLPRVAMVAGGVALLALVNIVVMASHTGNGHFLWFTFGIPMEYPMYPNAFLPGEMGAVAFAASVPSPGGWYWRTVAYVSQHLVEPSPFWRDGLRHCWMLVGLVAVWLALMPRHRRAPRGWLLLLPATVMAWGGVRSYGMIGAYVNNLALLYLGLALAAALAADGLRRMTPARARPLFDVGLTAFLLLQVFQPWAVPPADSSRVTTYEWRREPDDAKRQRMVAHQRHLAREVGRGNADVAPPALSATDRWHYFLSRLNHAGLTWFPSHARPHPDSAQAFFRLRAWLLRKSIAGEHVWVMQHQWFGQITGHPTGASIDAVRIVQWAGDPAPRTFIRDLRSGRFQWLLLDEMEGFEEWLPYGVGAVIDRHYERAGELPIYGDLSRWALIPVTGAELRPLHLFRWREPAEGMDE